MDLKKNSLIILTSKKLQSNISKIKFNKILKKLNQLKWNSIVFDDFIEYTNQNKKLLIFQYKSPKCFYKSFEFISAENNYTFGKYKIITLKPIEFPGLKEYDNIENISRICFYSDDFNIELLKKEDIHEIYLYGIVPKDFLKFFIN